MIKTIKADGSEKEFRGIGDYGGRAAPLLRQGRGCRGECGFLPFRGFPQQYRPQQPCQRISFYNAGESAGGGQFV